MVRDCSTLDKLSKAQPVALKIEVAGHDVGVLRFGILARFDGGCDSEFNHDLAVDIPLSLITECGLGAGARSKSVLRPCIRSGCLEV